MSAMRIQTGEYCPSCETDQSRKVVESRITMTASGPIRWRRCRCPACGAQWRTAELFMTEAEYAKMVEGTL